MANAKEMKKRNTGVLSNRDGFLSLNQVTIRSAQLRDLERLASLCCALWPKRSLEDNFGELRLILEGKTELVLTMPLAIFIAETNSKELVGFVEVDLRSHADGCSPAKPAAYIEGWYVAESFSRRGVGKMLIEKAEEWARTQHCLEIASDATIDNWKSHRAHEALGYEVVDACV